MVPLVPSSADNSRWRIGDQSKDVLEAEFRRERFPSTGARLKLAESLDVEPRRIQVWFQNRRQRTKGPAPDSPFTDSSSVSSDPGASAYAGSESGYPGGQQVGTHGGRAPNQHAGGYRDPAEAQLRLALERSVQSRALTPHSTGKRQRSDAGLAMEGQHGAAPRQATGSILSSSDDIINALMGFENDSPAVQRGGGDGAGGGSGPEGDMDWYYAQCAGSDGVRGTNLEGMNRRGTQQPAGLDSLHLLQASGAMPPMGDGAGAQGVLWYNNPEGQQTLPQPGLSASEDFDSWKNAADAVNSVLSCARRQYSLAVGKYNMSSTIAASPTLPPSGPGCLPPLPPLRPADLLPNPVLSFSAVRQHDADQDQDDTDQGRDGDQEQEGDLRAELRAAAEGGEQDECDSNGDHFGHMEISMLLA